MSPQQRSQKKKKHPLQHMIAGGMAGFVESSVCHPLDTIKTRMQLARQSSNPFQSTTTTSTPATTTALRSSTMESPFRLQHAHSRSITTLATTTSISRDGPIDTAARLLQREGVAAFYKGLSAVYTGIIPKMAIRFVAFEHYRDWGMAATATTNNRAMSTTSVTFLAGLASGLTEAVLIVTPAEVCKIRMQSTTATSKSQNVFQTAATIVRTEGVRALYKGVVPTMLRQGCNQAVNFTAYNTMKQRLLEQQTTELAPWQSLLIGGVSGGMGPLMNNPLDVVKTRLQQQKVTKGEIPKYTGLWQACNVIAREEGLLALWKGITPRLMRIMPGQAITFMTYEAVSERMHRTGWWGQ